MSEFTSGCTDDDFPKWWEKFGKNLVHDERLNNEMLLLAAFCAGKARGNKWQPMSTAPQNATWVIGQMADGEVRRVHWASDLSGSEQPAFQGWFLQSGNSFVECNPVRWMHLPTS